MFTMCNVFLLLVSGLFNLTSCFNDMPLPWTEPLKLGSEGNEVVIMCNLLARDVDVDLNTNNCDSLYNSIDENACKEFQNAHKLDPTGIFDSETANLLLELHSNDNIHDSGFTAASKGYLYKIHIPVYKNRSIETSATLYDANNKILAIFPARTHGRREDNVDYGWPDFGNGDVGLTQFMSNGNTITGIVEMDLNSPEPDPAMYGKWPVNRIVRGLEGNAAFMLPWDRDGQLIHTGNWTTQENGQWTPEDTMPNSSGCVHSHPSSIKEIYEKLVGIGVVVNENTYSGKDYPYKCQGIGVIELIG